MLADVVKEAKRQVEICNACRYCEGYCAVFPAISRQRSFVGGDIVQLANLCHNCRGCYYACQYIEPHEFAINIPKALSEVQQESWQDYAMPAGFARVFQHSGLAISFAVAFGFALIFWAMKALGEHADGEGFYALLSHGAMVAIFLPAFLLPLLSMAFSLRTYWRNVGGGRLRIADFSTAFSAAARMKNLSGGHEKGCNFEDEDRFSNSRRWRHQMVMYGFLLCFASTCSATVLHYVLNMPAPYGLISVPKLLGIPGGILLSIGTFAMVHLKLKSDRDLADRRAWGGEIGFALLLFFVSTSGLALYGLADTTALGVLLAAHLGAVLAFFLLMPYSKMVHGFYRLAALLKDAQIQRVQSEAPSS